jgi:hypothetical protein
VELRIKGPKRSIKGLRKDAKGAREEISAVGPDRPTPFILTLLSRPNKDTILVKFKHL